MNRHHLRKVLLKDQAEFSNALKLRYFAFDARSQRRVFNLGYKIVNGRHLFSESSSWRHSVIELRTPPAAFSAPPLLYFPIVPEVGKEDLSHVHFFLTFSRRSINSLVTPAE